MTVTPKTALVTAGGCHPESLAAWGFEPSVTGDIHFFTFGVES